MHRRNNENLEKKIHFGLEETWADEIVDDSAYKILRSVSHGVNTYLQETYPRTARTLRTVGGSTTGILIGGLAMIPAQTYVFMNDDLGLETHGAVALAGLAVKAVFGAAGGAIGYFSKPTSDVFSTEQNQEYQQQESQEQ